MNTPLRLEIAEELRELVLDVLAEASIVAGEQIYITTFPEEKRAKKVLSIIDSKMPEKKYILHLTGNEFREAKGFNDCLAKVKSILKGGTE